MKEKKNLNFFHILSYINAVFTGSNRLMDFENENYLGNN